MNQPCDEAVVRSDSSNAPCSPKSQAWVLAATILGSSMAFIDGTVVNVALPALQSSLHATVVDVQWVVESYGLFLAALLLIGGAMGDSFGRRSVFLFGTGLFAAASIGCGLSSSISQLIIARSFQGIGAAFLVPSSLAITQRLLRRKISWSRHRHLVGIHRHHHCSRSGAGWLADSACFLALGFPD